mgnify:CR=1 FL=1
MAVVTDDDRVHLKTIDVSKLMDNAVEVAEGLSVSDRVVNNPSAALLEPYDVPSEIDGLVTGKYEPPLPTFTIRPRTATPADRPERGRWGA